MQLQLAVAMYIIWVTPIRVVSRPGRMQCCTQCARQRLDRGQAASSSSVEL